MRDSGFHCPPLPCSIGPTDRSRREPLPWRSRRKDSPKQVVPLKQAFAADTFQGFGGGWGGLSSPGRSGQIQQVKLQSIASQGHDNPLSWILRLSGPQLLNACLQAIPEACGEK